MHEVGDGVGVGCGDGAQGREVEAVDAGAAGQGALPLVD
jgi:hypothetical protein